MKINSKLLLTSLLNVLWLMIGYAAPLLDTKDTWNQNILEPVKTACSPNGLCWEWLPIPEKYDAIISEQESDTSRLQSWRQVANPVSEFTSRSLKDTLEETRRETRSPALPKQKITIPSTWSLGGMPFNVLYMYTRLNHAATTESTASQQKVSSTTKSSLGEHSNSRITSRNQSSTRRRYFWTLPPLFIYGLTPPKK
nr:PREDICTED: uncharacterized protein LOC105678850 isoform X2 [Linepithema humile]